MAANPIANLSADQELGRLFGASRSAAAEVARLLARHDHAYRRLLARLTRGPCAEPQLTRAQAALARAGERLAILLHRRAAEDSATELEQFLADVARRVEEITEEERAAEEERKKSQEAWQAELRERIRRNNTAELPETHGNSLNGL